MMSLSAIRRFSKLPFVVPPRELYEEKYKNTIMEYTSAVMVDRTRTFTDCGFANLIIEDEIPTVVVDPGNFCTIVDVTATNIINQATIHNKPIAVMYSGGLDSTCVTAALLKNGANITIVGSQASIDENPTFFSDVLLSNESVKCEIGNPLMFLLNHRNDYTFVTGECGAHLMGTINWTKYGGRELDNIDAIEADHLAAGIFRNPEPFFNIPQETRTLLLKVLDKSPRSFKSNYDAQWWAIFALKWQFVTYRNQLWIGELCPSLINFFMNDRFQMWALYNDASVKCPDYQWRNYKMPIRDYIYSYYPNRQASYDLPKRASMERTYKQLELRGRFVLNYPKQIGFMRMSDKRMCHHYLTLVH